VKKKKKKEQELTLNFIKVWLLRAPYEFFSDMSVLETHAILSLNPDLQLLGVRGGLLIQSKYVE